MISQNSVIFSMLRTENSKLSRPTLLTVSLVTVFQLRTENFGANLNVKDTLRRLHDDFVLVPADKAANNVIVVCKRYYI